MASSTSPPRSLRPHARLETVLTEAGRPRKHPPLQGADRSEKAQGHTSGMHVSGESDSSIVPKKQANKGRSGAPGLPAESVEGRGLTKENAEPSLLDRTLRRASRSRGLLGVRQAAMCGLIVIIRDKSRMREFRTYGSVRGVLGNRHPYRDHSVDW